MMLILDIKKVHTEFFDNTFIFEKLGWAVMCLQVIEIRQQFYQ